MENKRKVRVPDKIHFPLENIDGDNFRDNESEIICLSEILDRLEYLENR